jgi:hypothetical protein
MRPMLRCVCILLCSKVVNEDVNKACTVDHVIDCCASPVNSSVGVGKELQRSPVKVVPGGLSLQLATSKSSNIWDRIAASSIESSGTGISDQQHHSRRETALPLSPSQSYPAASRRR